MFTGPHQLNSLSPLAIVNTINEISHSLTHGLLTYVDKGLFSVATACKIIHSKVIPPNAIRPQNIAKEALKIFKKYKFSETLNGLEFCWAPVFFDTDNDGDLDIYMAGALGRGNDGSIGDCGPPVQAVFWSMKAV